MFQSVILEALVRLSPSTMRTSRTGCLDSLFLLLGKKWPKLSCDSKVSQIPEPVKSDILGGCLIPVNKCF